MFVYKNKVVFNSFLSLRFSYFSSKTTNILIFLLLMDYWLVLFTLAFNKIKGTGYHFMTYLIIPYQIIINLKTNLPWIFSVVQFSNSTIASINFPFTIISIYSRKFINFIQWNLPSVGHTPLVSIHSYFKLIAIPCAVIHHSGLHNLHL